MAITRVRNRMHMRIHAFFQMDFSKGNTLVQ